MMSLVKEFQHIVYNALTKGYIGGNRWAKMLNVLNTFLIHEQNKFFFLNKL